MGAFDSVAEEIARSEAEAEAVKAAAAQAEADAKAAGEAFAANQARLNALFEAQEARKAKEIADEIARKEAEEARRARLEAEPLLASLVFRTITTTTEAPTTTEGRRFGFRIIRPRTTESPNAAPAPVETIAEEPRSAVLDFGLGAPVENTVSEVTEVVEAVEAVDEPLDLETAESIAFNANQNAIAEEIARSEAEAQAVKAAAQEEAVIIDPIFEDDIEEEAITEETPSGSVTALVKEAVTAFKAAVLPAETVSAEAVEAAEAVQEITDEEIENLKDIKEILAGDIESIEVEEETEISTEIPVGEKPNFFYFF